MLDGWLIFFRGWSACQSRPRMWLYLIPPMVFNFLIFVGLFYVGFEFLSPALMNVLQRWIGDIPVFIRYLMMGLLIYVFYLFVVYFFNIVGLLIGSFFYTLLAVQYARLSEQPSAEGFHPRFVQVMKYELIKFGILTGVGAVLTLFSWLMPYLSLLFLFFLIFLVAYEYFDYAFEGLKMSYAERFTWIRTHLWRFFSAGLIIYLILSIPLIGFLLCPVCVVGATDLVFAKQQGHTA